MTSNSMEYVMENNSELEELEITEIDAALLRDLLEELDKEENIDTKENSLIQLAVDETITTTTTDQANYDMFDIIEQQHHHVDLSNFSRADQMMAETSSSLPLPSDDMLAPDWYGRVDNVVGMVGFEYCNNIGDYSYLYNETTYCHLWEGE